MIFLAAILATIPPDHHGHLTTVTLRHAVAIVHRSAPYTPVVQQGRAYRVVDATGAQVGAVIEPVGCAIIADDHRWLGGQLDTDASGTVNTLDFLAFADLHAAGSVFADFDCDGQTRWEDRQQWLAGWRATYPADVEPCDGYINGADWDRWMGWFVAGDARADMNGDSWVTGDDWQIFTDSFAAGIP